MSMSIQELGFALGRLAITPGRQSAQCVKHLISSRAVPRHFSSTTSFRATSSTPLEPIKAASEIDFSTFSPSDASVTSSDSTQSGGLTKAALARLRVVPASPSYFTSTPRFIDDFLLLARLLQKHLRLPTYSQHEAPKVQWVTVESYRNSRAETVKVSKFRALVALCQRLSIILPDIMPEEVSQTLDRFRRTIDPFSNKPRPIMIDEHGRARAIGRRKTSHAVVYLVEGDGQVLVNGQSLATAFGRFTDREAAIWALKATGRLDKYNVFGIAKGGGTTGQAEALTLAVARALMVHEPGLKAVLRKAGVVNRDPRMVERKKPGKKKARKMPAWVKR